MAGRRRKARIVSLLASPPINPCARGPLSHLLAPTWSDPETGRAPPNPPIFGGAPARGIAPFFFEDGIFESETIFWSATMNETQVLWTSARWQATPAGVSRLDGSTKISAVFLRQNVLGAVNSENDEEFTTACLVWTALTGHLMSRAERGSAHRPRAWRQAACSEPGPAPSRIKGGRGRRGGVCQAS